MTAETERAATRLTEAQRRAVLWLPADGSAREIDKAAPREVSFYALKEIVLGDPRRQVAAIYRLVERANSHAPVNGRWPKAQYRLTPLGLAVRAHIAKEEGE